MAIAQRQVRWHWHRSPHLENGVRYHFLIVDDKHRSETLDTILSFLQPGGAIEEVRRKDYSSQNGLRALFASFDSRAQPSLIQWSRIRKKVVQDRELYERQGTAGIETYVEKFCAGE